jgi:hypothetical protein
MIVVLIPLGKIPRRYAYYHMFYYKARKTFVYNGILRLLIEGYLELSLCSFLNLLSTSYKNFSNIF